MESELPVELINQGPAQSQQHQKTQKFLGFDYLRAFFSIIIVAYKTDVVKIPGLLLPGRVTTTLSDYVLSGAVGALAVPVFLQISLFLFDTKSEHQGLRYFLNKRLPRLLYLYLFWVGLITVFDVVWIDGAKSLKNTTHSIKSLLEFIVSGNSTPYFFFFSLIFVTVLSEVLILICAQKSNQAKIKLNYLLLLISCSAILSLSFLNPMLEHTGIQVPFLTSLSHLATWDYTPLNFIPYIFTAAITAQEYNAGKLDHLTQSLKYKLKVLLSLGLFFFALEWILTSNRLLIQVDQAPLDHYLRLSLVFGSWFLLYAAILTRRRANPFIRLLSDCSLGLYGFHVFFSFKRIFPFSHVPFLIPLFETFPLLEILSAFSLAVVGSILLTLLLKRTRPLRQFV